MKWREDRGERDGYRFEDVGALSFRCVFVFHLSISHPWQFVLGERTVHELYSLRRHLGCISQGTELIFEAASQPPKTR